MMWIFKIRTLPLYSTETILEIALCLQLNEKIIQKNMNRNKYLFSQDGQNRTKHLRKTKQLSDLLLSVSDLE